LGKVKTNNELPLHPDDVDKGFGKGPEARFLSDSDIKPILKDLHDRNLLTKLSFGKLKDAAKLWHTNPEIEGVDMSAIQFYPGQIPEDVGNKILEAQPNTLIYQKLKPERVLAAGAKIPRPDFEDENDGVTIAVFYPYQDTKEMNSRWDQVMKVLDGEEEDMLKSSVLANIKYTGKLPLNNRGDLRFRARGRRSYPVTFDEETRMTEVWNPARYMGTYAEHANDSVSLLFVKYYSFPTKGFSPVSLEHAYYIFEAIRKVPGPWASLGRVLKGINWDVKDNFKQVVSNYDKTKGVITVENVEGPGEFVPVLQEPGFYETIWHTIAESICHYMKNVYGILTDQDLEDFEMLYRGVYEKPIRWTDDPIVDYLAFVLSNYQDVFSFYSAEIKDPETMVFYRQTQTKLGPHNAACGWILETLYRRFTQ